MFAAGLCCSDAGRSSINVLTLVQDVPVLSPVLQKGAYWRQTCPVLFDVPLETDEDSDTWNLSCARLSRNRVCVRVCVCVCGWGGGVFSVCLFFRKARRFMTSFIA